MRFDLVFEGGGAKGAAFAGALRAFEEGGHTVGRLLGTSVGAITAALVAAGYTSAEILEALSEKRDGRNVLTSLLAPPTPFTPDEIDASHIYALLQQIDIPLIPASMERKIDRFLAEWMASQSTMRHIFAFIERGGWFSADPLLEWLKLRLGSGTHAGKPRRYAELTLEQFRAETGTDVSFVASDVTSRSMLILNHRTAPDLPLAWAVRMSAGLPFVWPAAVWQESFGRYRGRDMQGHDIVDGGLLSNFPIELFVSHDASVKSVMGEDASRHVVGLLLDASLPVPGVERSATPSGGFHLGQLGVLPRFSDIIETTLGARDKVVAEALAPFMVNLPVGDHHLLAVPESITQVQITVVAGCATHDLRARLVREGRPTEASTAHPGHVVLVGRVHGKGPVPHGAQREGASVEHRAV